MTEENKSGAASLLARLRGVGGAKFNKPAPQAPSNPSGGSVNISAPEQSATPKRDIKELYDFIDKYCADKEAENNQSNL